MKKAALLVSIIMVAACIFMPGCSSVEDSKKAIVKIKMATTTSTENSGLLKFLLPKFKKDSGIEIMVIPSGTGKAIKLAKSGDVDLIFVHARSAEEKFVQEGFGVNRKDVMYNDFIIVGDVADPAKISGSKDAKEALKKIAASNSQFISRGDDSGTHKKEKKLWKAAGVQPEGKWYVEAGQGMGAVLNMANEKKAYTLVDRGTYIAFENKIKLKIVVEGDKDLFNPYGIIAVNKKKYSHVKYDESMKFIDWIVSKKGQNLIQSYKKKGKQLFHPNAK